MERSDVNEVEQWFERRNLVLDLANLSQEQLKEGSIFLGGSDKEIVKPEDKFEYQNVGLVVFNWGDEKAKDVFANMLEHDDNPAPEALLPFSATTKIGNYVWTLAIQDRRFAPAKDYVPGSYKVLSFIEPEPEKFMEEFLDGPAPRPKLLSKVASRWMLFEFGRSIEPQDDKHILLPNF